MRSSRKASACSASSWPASASPSFSSLPRSFGPRRRSSSARQRSSAFVSRARGASLISSPLGASPASAARSAPRAWRSPPASAWASAMIALRAWCSRPAIRSRPRRRGERWRAMALPSGRHLRTLLRRKVRGVRPAALRAGNGQFFARPSSGWSGSYSGVQASAHFWSDPQAPERHSAPREQLSPCCFMAAHRSVESSQ